MLYCRQGFSRAGWVNRWVIEGGDAERREKGKGGDWGPRPIVPTDWEVPLAGTNRPSSCHAPPLTHRKQHWSTGLSRFQSRLAAFKQVSVNIRNTSLCPPYQQMLCHMCNPWWNMEQLIAGFLGHLQWGKSEWVQLLWLRLLLPLFSFFLKVKRSETFSVTACFWTADIGGDSSIYKIIVVLQYSESIVLKISYFLLLCCSSVMELWGLGLLCWVSSALQLQQHNLLSAHKQLNHLSFFFTNL